MQTIAIEGNGTRDSHMGDGYAESDTMYTLNATEQHKVAYAIEGNMVDREARQNGIGVSKDTCPSLNTQDKHAVAYGIDQQGGKGGANYQENVMPTLCSDSHGTPHAVCFQQNQREEVREMGKQAGALSAEPGSHQQNYVLYPDKARSLCARADSSPCVDRGQNIVCYGVDCRNAKLDEEKCHTLQAKANGGGFSLNCTPSVIYRQDGFAGYSEGVGTLKASGGDMGGHGKHRR